MSERPNTDGGRQTPIGGDLIIPVAGLLFTLYYFSTIIDAPWTAQIGAFFIGAILIALVLLFLVRAGIDLSAKRVSLAIGPLIEPREMVVPRLIFLGMTVAYLIVIDWLGFTLTTFVYLVGAMFLLNRFRRKGLVFALAACISVAGYILFIATFEARFPLGPFEKIVGTFL